MWSQTYQLKSCSFYSQSRPHVQPKLNKETPDAYEARTWHYRIHTEDGRVVIPAMALRNCIAETAKFLSLQIPGKGKATYTKHFESGILITENIVLSDHDGNPIVPPTDLGLQKVLSMSPSSGRELVDYDAPNNEVYGDWVFVPADGVPGSGKRVWKCYPMIAQWQGEFTVQVVDDTITKEVFNQVLSQAGLLIGLGRFRVRNRGTYGRFSAVEIN